MFYQSCYLWSTLLQIGERHDGVDLKTFATGIILDVRTNPFLEGENDVDIKVYAKWIKKPFQTPKEVQARNLEDVGQARERKFGNDMMALI